MFKYLFNNIKMSPHRNQLEIYLKDFLPKLEGSILDIGSKNRRYDNLFKNKPISIDIIENKEKGVQFGDVIDLKFNTNNFDNVVCLEVLEYLPKIDKALSEISRVLKEGGYTIISVPFMYRAHEDNARYTKKYLLELLYNYFSDVKIYPIGNFYTIILDIIRGNIIKIKFLPLKYFLYIPYLLFIILIPLSKYFKDENYTSGYFIVCKK